MPDAVERALEALYDIWEYWQKSVGLTLSQQDGVVTGDADGETAAGLVFARGGKTHDFVEFGELSDAYRDTYYDHYGSWRWQPYSDPRERYSQRNASYARHVEGHEVLPPLQAAIRWLTHQPQLRAR
ncbi:MAG: hypothetical protein ACYCO3_02175 [Mycobacteriales bacterium]